MDIEHIAREIADINTRLVELTKRIQQIEMAKQRDTAVRATPVERTHNYRTLGEYLGDQTVTVSARGDLGPYAPMDDDAS